MNTHNIKENEKLVFIQEKSGFNLLVGIGLGVLGGLVISSMMNDKVKKNVINSSKQMTKHITNNVKSMVKKEQGGVIRKNKNMSYIEIQPKS